jgi:hypothetical protein
MSLCQTFRDLSFQTWRLLEKARNVSHQPLEETITDNNIIELKSRHTHEVITTTYTRHQEAKTGADWEWWFTNTDKSAWFGVRVQAKILNLTTERFAVLNYKNQTNVLINDAQKNGLYPLYCFYSQWALSTSHSPNKYLTFPDAPESYGCSIVDAHTIKNNKNNKNSNTLASVMTNAFPWSCLVCCRGTISSSGSGNDSLPNMVRSFIGNAFIQENHDDNSSLPEIIDRPPQHILALLDGEVNDSKIDDPNLAGAIVIIGNKG